jgi:hypothetical protein
MMHSVLTLNPALLVKRLQLSCEYLSRPVVSSNTVFKNFEASKSLTSNKGTPLVKDQKLYNL